MGYIRDLRPYRLYIDGVAYNIFKIHTLQKCIQNRPSTLRGQDKQLFVFWPLIKTGICHFWVLFDHLWVLFDHFWSFRIFETFRSYQNCLISVNQVRCKNTPEFSKFLDFHFCESFGYLSKLPKLLMECSPLWGSTQKTKFGKWLFPHPYFSFRLNVLKKNRTFVIPFQTPI